MRKRLKTVIHVDQLALRKNRKTGSRDPVVTVKTYKSNVRAHQVQIGKNTQIIYRPDKPLPCGASVWLESTEEVTVLS